MGADILQKQWISLLGKMPKKRFSKWMGQLAETEVPKPILTNFLKLYSRHYRVAVDEASRELAEYTSFNDFFTRTLKDGMRHIEGEGTELSAPCDGVLSQYGVLKQGPLVQVKGIDYNLTNLLQDTRFQSRLENGRWATIYLSPKDYHRVHAPIGGHIVSACYVPGTLFPVNTAAVKHVPDLFAINERITIYMETPVGLIALIMVGACVVGKISLDFDNLVTNTGHQQHIFRDYPEPIAVSRGQEVGKFNLGSTVVLVCENPELVLQSGLVHDTTVRLGQKLMALTPKTNNETPAEPT